MLIAAILTLAGVELTPEQAETLYGALLILVTIINTILRKFTGEPI